MRKVARIAAWLALIVVGLLLALDVAYFVNGSLEWFPTDEQQDKIRRVTAVLGVCLAVLELGLWLLLRRLGSRSTSPRVEGRPYPLRERR